MKALLVKSQFVEVEGLTAFGPRFLDESLKLRARTLVVDDFLPTLVALSKLTQHIKHGASLCLTKLWQFFNDFRCAHVEIIALVGNLSGERLAETFLRRKRSFVTGRSEVVLCPFLGDSQRSSKPEVRRRKISLQCAPKPVRRWCRVEVRINYESRSR